MCLKAFFIIFIAFFQIKSEKISLASASAETLFETADLGETPTGTVGLNSSSFFYKSSGRGTSSTTFEGRLNGKFDAAFLHGEGNAQIYSFVTDNPQMSFESKEMYLATQDLMLGNWQFSIGRRHYDWTRVDHIWTMMSLWSPRFTWDELHPQTIGMTGAFLHYDDGNFQFLAFGSPIAIPERGTPIEEKNGNIVSPNPFWKPLPTNLTMNGTSHPVQYTLATPPIKTILFRPNFGIRGRYKIDEGFWGSLSSGVLPVNMTQLAAEPYLRGSNFQVDIRPQFPMRNINTLELGYEAPTEDWNLWISASYEQPFQFKNQENWLNPIITPATIVSVGNEIDLTSNFSLAGSALFIHEEPFTHSSSLPNVSINLPSRFPLKQGIKVHGTWKYSDDTESTFAWTQDLIQRNHFVSADLKHAFRKSNLIIGGGTDLMFCKTTQGWVGQYFGDDRIRGWLKYVF